MLDKNHSLCPHRVHNLSTERQKQASKQVIKKKTKYKLLPGYKREQRRNSVAQSVYFLNMVIRKAELLKRDQGMTAWLTEGKGPMLWGEHRQGMCAMQVMGRNAHSTLSVMGRRLEVRVSQRRDMIQFVFLRSFLLLWRECIQKEQ